MAYAVVVALALYTHYYFVFLWAFEVVYVPLVWLGTRTPWRRVGRDAAAAFTRLHAARPATDTTVETEPDAPVPDAQNMNARLSRLRAAAGAAMRHPRLRDALGRMLGHPLTTWLVLQLAAIALFAPWLPTAWRQATDPPVPPWRSAIPWGDALGQTLYALAIGQSLPQNTSGDLLVALALGICALALAVWLWSARRRVAGSGPGEPWLLVGSITVPFALILLASARAPLFHVRYMFIYATTFTVVLSYGLAQIARRMPLLTVILLGVLLGGAGYAEYERRTAPAYAKDDYRSAVAYIAQRARPGDAVLVNAGYIYPAFVYYYSGAVAWRGRLTDYAGSGGDGIVVAQTGSLDAPPDLGWGSPQSDFYATDEASTTQALARLLQGHPRLWVLRANDTVNDPRGVIRDYLSVHALLVDELTVPGESYVKAQAFVARGAASAAFAPVMPLQTTFGERIGLTGYSAPSVAAPERPLALTLYWRALAPIDVDYHVSVGLYDARGRRWSSLDGVPVGRLAPTGDWPLGQVLPDVWNLPVPRGTPPGAYSVQVTLYDPATGKPLPTPGGVEGVRARVGAVQVARLASGNDIAPWPPRPTFGDQLALDRYTLSPGPLKPGEALRADLLWQALKAPAGDDLIALNLIDERGRLWATQESQPVDGRYATSLWTRGEYVADSRELTIPADVPNGRYRVTLSVALARNHEVIGVRNGWWPFAADSYDLGAFDVQGRERVTKPPAAIANPTRAQFGENALLIGYELKKSPGVAAGSALTVTLFWQALMPSRTNNKVFVHVVGANEQIVGQRDSEPGDGAYPMAGWQAEEYLVDTYRVEMPPNLPAGAYTVYIGMYDPRTTMRLPIIDVDGKPAGDRWRLASVDWP